uniref:protein IQ-domain 26-like n=1 Tax=Erigeron canadensis TaxID=72917 RepID=UPI001CB9B4CC|nr:protein IQ-domain 26-like [Erigeron canadensis]
MGKTLRWFKGLFGLKKESKSGERKDKVPSCIGRRSRRNPVTSPPLKQGCYNINEQNRRAIAVAAATTAAADAAVAAAQAAVAFVRLTSQNRFVTTVADRENSAAIKIQTHFRGYLSKKALKALKSLVKLQAVVRGFLVRKKTVETLHGMEALFRARSNVYAHKFRLQEDKFHSKRSLKKASEGRSRRTSSSYPIPIDGRSNLIDVQPNLSKSRLLRANTWAWSAESNTQTPSPLFVNPHRLSVPGFPNYYDYEPRFSTTHNTPRFAYSCGPNMYKSIYNDLSKDDSYTGNPSYMSKTESFRAKARSKSAPKQRPDYGLGPKRRASLPEVECGPIMEKSKSPSLLEISSFKNCVMRKIGKSPKV